MKTYRTTAPAWDKTRGEYQKPTETPEELKTYSFYDRIETRENPLKLFAIGGRIKDNFCHNWDIYADERGTLYSIARNGSGAGSTYFGDISHIKRLMKQGHFHGTLTPYGFKMMKGEK